MNYTMLFSLAVFISSCSSLLKGQGDDYSPLVKNATEILLNRKIITNRCITQNDTIYILIKTENKLSGKYYYNNLLVSSPSVRCDYSNLPNQCLRFLTDSISAKNKLYFDFSCAGSVNGYLIINKNKEIEDVRYVKRSD